MNLGSFSQSIAGLQISGGTLTGSGTLTSSSDYDVQGGMVDVVLAGSSVGVHKTGPATAILTRANTFGGSTTISGGALQADFGSTIPASGYLTLDGGVLETLAGGTFTRSLGPGGSNAFQITANGGGFSTANAPCVVNIGGKHHAGDRDVGNQRRPATGRHAAARLDHLHQFGDLRESARSAAAAHARSRLTAMRTRPATSPCSPGRSATRSAAARWLKTGNGTLYLQGAASNTYSGPTTIMGTVFAAKSGGAVAIPGDLMLSETGDGTGTVLQLGGDNEIASTAALTFSTPVASARLDLNGHAQTVSAISGDSHAVIEGLFDNTGLNSDSTLTVNNAADCVFAGVIRNSAQGSGTGKVNLVKGGGGDLLLSGIEFVHRLDDRQRRHAGSRRLDPIVRRRQRRPPPARSTSTAPPVTRASAARSPARERCRFIKGRTVCMRARAATPR